MPAFPLPHVFLEQAASARIVWFLAPLLPAVDRCRWLCSLQTRLASVLGLAGMLVIALGLDLARSDVVRWVIAGGRGTPLQAETTLNGFEQAANGLTARRDFNLHALIAFAIDLGISLAGLVVEVLGDVQGALMTFEAEGSSPLMHVVGMGTG